MDAVPTIYMGNSIYSVGDIVDRTLIAKINVDVYGTKPSLGGKKIGIIKAGNPAGVVNSWLTENDGSIWWMFYSWDNRYYVIKHQPGIFDVAALKQQGVLSIPEKREEEKQKEEANLPWYEQLGKGLSKTLVNVALIGGAAYVVMEIIKSKKR